VAGKHSDFFGGGFEPEAIYNLRVILKILLKNNVSTT
jgi:hypothetical protein